MATKKPTFTVVLHFGGQKVAEFDFVLAKPTDKCVIDLNPAEMRKLMAAYDEATGYKAPPPRAKLEVLQSIPADLRRPDTTSDIKRRN